MLESDWLLFIVTSNMPCVDITNSMFLRDSGIVSYCVVKVGPDHFLQTKHAHEHFELIIHIELYI